MITRRAASMLTPREKELQRVTIMYVHLLDLLGVARSADSERALQDVAGGYTPKDLTEDLFSRLDGLRGSSSRRFYRIINDAKDITCIELRSWWERKFKERAAVRRGASNRRKAAAAGLTVSKGTK